MEEKARFVPFCAAIWGGEKMNPTGGIHPEISAKKIIMDIVRESNQYTPTFSQYTPTLFEKRCFISMKYCASMQIGWDCPRRPFLLPP